MMRHIEIEKIGRWDLALACGILGHARFDRRALQPASQATSGAGFSQ